MDYITYNILKHYKGLNERERFVVENRSQNTLKSLGEQIGVTPARVRQIEAKAYRKMIGRYLYFLQHEAEFREYLDIRKIAEAKKISLERQVEKSIGIEGETILVDKLPFQMRTINALKKHGFFTEARLIDQYYKDPEEILAIKNIGEKSYEVIIRYLAGRVETIRQNSTKAGEHQTPKSTDMVDKTHDSIRQLIVRKDGFFNGMKMDIWKALDEYRSESKIRDTLEEIDAGRELFERRILRLLDELSQQREKGKE